MNCKYFKRDLFSPSRFAKCKKFLIVDNNVDFLIDGKKIELPETMYYCSTARKFDHLCGEEGTSYESKRVSK